MTKISGTLIARFMQQTGRNGGCFDQCLEIYRQKRGYRAAVWNSSFPGWKGTCRKPFKTRHFTEAKRDDDFRAIREAMGFTPAAALPGYGHICAYYPDTNFTRGTTVS